MRWTSDARSDYTALFPLAGRLLSSINDEEFELKENDALLLDPGSAAQVYSREETEILTLTQDRT
jgi:mannose-6-phosphate isomerase-like protein (cupin superfamily)